MGESTAAPAVRTEGLGKDFAGQAAVADLDLEIHRGEVFGLLGPNGAGKTTTIRMLTTLLSPSAGRAWVCGHDVSTEPDTVRRRIGYVMQQVPARWNMTGREILEIEAALYHVPRRRVGERVAAVLGATGLQDVADRLFQHFSGGTQKRLDIACALLNQPELLVLDEPTLELDVRSRHDVWQQIHRLRDEGVTVLLATNYLDEADRLCDRLMIIDGGQAVVEGTPEELKREVGGDVLTVAAPATAALGALLEGRPWALRIVVTPHAVHVHVKDAGRALPELLTAVQGCEVSSVTYTRPSLDDVFLLHTGTTLGDRTEDIRP